MPNPGGDLRRTGLPESAQVFFHPRVMVDKPGGKNLLQEIDSDLRLKQFRRIRPYYPFASKAEWELGSWLCNGSLSQNDIDSFLKLDYVRPLYFRHPSFRH